MNAKSEYVNCEISKKRYKPLLGSPFLTVLIALHLTAFVAATYGFGIYLFSALVPDMRQELGFDYTVVGVITGAGQAGFMLFAIGGAILSHRIGGAMVAIMSAVVCASCLVIIPMFSSIIIIGSLLTVLGGCAASVYVPMVDLVSRSISVSHRGKVLGLISSGTSYGVFLNGLLIPVFLASGNWRGIWVIVGVITFGISVSAYFTLRKAGLIKRQVFSKSCVKPKPIKTDIKKSGVFQIIQGAEPWVLIIWFITFLNGFTTLPFQNFLSSYIRDELGFTVALNGQVWTMIGFIGMFSGFALGALSDRIGTRRTMIITYVFLCASSLLLVFRPYEGLVITSGIIFALAFYPIFGLVPAYIAKNPSKLSGTTIFAVANVTLGVGGIFGNILGGISKTWSGSFIWMYFSIAVLSVILCLLSLLLPNESQIPMRRKSV